MIAKVFHSDCLDWTRRQRDDSFDLVFCSPPYEDRRKYGELGFGLRGQAWVDWAAERFIDQVRICRGPVCWVVEGFTKDGQWSATPALLMADLYRAGIMLRKPPIYHRQGIPGSGGPQWLRNDYEFIVCASKGKLAYADNTAMGWPCKYDTGGAFSYRTQDGTRANESKHNDGSKARNGRQRGRPEITNPGNVIKCKVGKGHMGSDLAHENEAPYPEALVEFFVHSFCPPGGVVFDGFCGSGTTAAVCIKTGRHFAGCEIRESQVELTRRRIEEARAIVAAEEARASA